MSNPFRYFNSSPEVIRLVVMMYVRYPLSLRNVEDLLAERGIDISHETVRFWWNRFGPMFAAEIRKRRVRAHARLSSVAMAPGLGLCEGQRQALLSLARRRSEPRPDEIGEPVAVAIAARHQEQERVVGKVGDRRRPHIGRRFVGFARVMNDETIGEHDGPCRNLDARDPVAEKIEIVAHRETGIGGDSVRREEVSVTRGIP
jgi:hypothetical protein